MQRLGRRRLAAMTGLCVLVATLPAVTGIYAASASDAGYSGHGDGSCTSDLQCEAGYSVEPDTRTISTHVRVDTRDVPSTTRVDGLARATLVATEAVPEAGTFDFAITLELVEWAFMADDASEAGYGGGRVQIDVEARHLSCALQCRSVVSVVNADGRQWDPWAGGTVTVPLSLSNFYSGPFPAGTVEIRVNLSTSGLVDTMVDAPIRAYADIQAGLSVTSITHRTRDVFKPDITWPENSAQLTAGSPVVQGRAEPGSAVALYRQVGLAWHPLATGTADAAGNFAIATSLGDGSHRLQVRSTDATGTEKRGRELGFSIDSQAPLAPPIDAPADNALVPGRFRVSGRSTDACWYGHTFRLFVDGTLAGDLVHHPLENGMPACAAPWAFDLSLPPGQHTVAVTDQDRVGHESAAAVLTLTVDAVAPTATLGSASGVQVRDRAIRGTAGDDVGVRHIAVRWTTADGGDIWRAVPCDGCGAGQVGTWRADVPAEVLSADGAGPYRVTVFAEDMAGNRSTEHSATLAFLL